ASASSSPAPSASASSNPSASPSASSSTTAGRPPTGFYSCSVGSTPVGSFTLTEVTYRTNSGGRGIWTYDEGSNKVTFIGSDLSNFDGRYDTSNRNIQLTSKTNNAVVTCVQ
ncbi:MAG: hypothetical protein QOC98_355, partial [Frankiaceae bacterium]|nr:hypothetical protein [Frankiaceae bacterium]